MAAAAVKNFAHEIDVEDVEYLRQGDTPLLARLFKPRGQGPFPAIVELHGGAWCMGDRLNDTTINEQLARGGILVAALDFRVPPAASYPASLADINTGSMDQISGDRAADKARHGVHVRNLEWRPSGDAARDAAERFSLCIDPTFRRF